MNSLRAIPLFAILLSILSNTKAEIPLDIEGLLAPEGIFKFDAALTYAHADQTGFSAGDLITVQVSPTQFVFIPVQMSERQTNTDILVPLIGLRFGLNSDTEIFAKTSWLSEQTRAQDGSGQTTSSKHRFNDAWLGLNYRFIREDDQPALIGFAEIALAEHNDRRTSYAKSFQVGYTIYRSLDPVVLSLTTSFLHRRPRNTERSTVKPGDLLAVTPQISFALNDKVTLMSGLTWRNQKGSSKQNHPSEVRKTSSTLNLGVSYLWDRNTAFSLSTRFNSGSGQGAEIGLAVQMKLEDLVR